MQRLATLAVLAALILPTVASGQDYTFGDWARDRGYEPGDVMPYRMHAQFSDMDSLDGIDEYDWTTTPTWYLSLTANHLTSVESGAFSGLTYLERLVLSSNQLSTFEPGAFSGLANLKLFWLDGNQLSSIEPGAFSGLTNLTELDLNRNPLSNIESGAFRGLTKLRTLDLNDNQLSSIESGDFERTDESAVAVFARQPAVEH